MNIQSKQSITYAVTGAGIGLAIAMTGTVMTAYFWLHSLGF